MPALGLDWHERFTACDELTGVRYDWGQRNAVRLDPYLWPAHIFTLHPAGQAPAAADATIEQVADGTPEQVADATTAQVADPSTEALVSPVGPGADTAVEPGGNPAATAARETADGPGDARPARKERRWTS